MKNTVEKLLVVVLVALLLLGVNLVIKINEENTDEEISSHIQKREMSSIAPVIEEAVVKEKEEVWVAIDESQWESNEDRGGGNNINRDELEDLLAVLKEEGDLSKIEDILMEISELDPELNSIYENLEEVKVARYIRLVEEISQSKHIRDSVKRDFTRLSLTTFSELFEDINSSQELSMEQKVEYSEAALSDLMDIALEMKFSRFEISQFVAEGLEDSPNEALASGLLERLELSEPDVIQSLFDLEDEDS